MDDKEEELEVGLDDQIKLANNGTDVAAADHDPLEKEELQELLAFQQKTDAQEKSSQKSDPVVIDIDEEHEPREGIENNESNQRSHAEKNPEEEEQDDDEAREGEGEQGAEGEGDGESDAERGEILNQRRTSTNIKQNAADEKRRRLYNSSTTTSSSSSAPATTTAAARDDSSDSELSAVTLGLPSVLLEYDQQFFFMFNDPEELQTDDVLFYGDDKLLNSNVALFLRALKNAFEIVTDVTIEFPQLELSFPQDLIHAKSIKLRTLVSFHEALQLSKGIPKNENQPLKVVMFNHHRSLVQQYNKLLNILRIGGRAQNPIVLSDDEEEEEEEEEPDHLQIQEVRTNIEIIDEVEEPEPEPVDPEHGVNSNTPNGTENGNGNGNGQLKRKEPDGDTDVSEGAASENSKKTKSS